VYWGTVSAAPGSSSLPEAAFDNLILKHFSSADNETEEHRPNTEMGIFKNSK
jgi:hypothetical protein